MQALCQRDDCPRFGQPHIDYLGRPGACTGHRKRSKEPCSKLPVAGTSKCRMHGSAKGTRGRAAGERRLAVAAVERSVGELLEQYRPDADHLDPGAELLDTLSLAVGMRRVYEHLVSDLREVRSRIEVHDDGTVMIEQGLYGPDHLGDLRAHVVEQRLAHWTGESARISKLAIDAGIETRRLELEEAELRRFVAFIRGVLIDAGVWGREDMAQIVERHLRSNWRALPPGGDQ